MFAADKKNKGINRAKPAVPGLFVLIMISLTSLVARADDFFISNEIQFLFGEDFKTGSNFPDETAFATMTFDHFSSWKKGDNYLLVDVSRELDGREKDETNVYGEYYSRLSLSKISGKNLSSGLLADVLIGVGINAGKGVRVATYGPSLNLNMPGFDFFQLDFYAYDDLIGDLETTYQITPIWQTTFDIGRQKFLFKGFVDFIGARNGGKRQIITQPQFRWVKGNFFAGVEWWYWKNKFGVEGLDESFPQLLLGFTW